MDEDSYIVAGIDVTVAAVYTVRGHWSRFIQEQSFGYNFAIELMRAISVCSQFLQYY